MKKYGVSIIALTAVLLVTRTAASGAERLDLLIRNGMIVDGAGNPWFPADVGVRDGMIVKVGKIGDTDAARVIDAVGHIVAPGFIDIHNHSDAELLAMPGAESYLYQGVTTMCVGNCGFSAAPSDSISTYTAYFDRLERNGISPNVVALVGHGQLRSFVVGNEGRAATPAEMKRMCELVEQFLNEGASGMSTGLAYAPGMFADTEEIVALCEILARHDALYATHIRGDAALWRPAIEEAIGIAERTGVALQISHLESHYPNWGAQDMALRMLEDARARGIEVTTDVPPYLCGSTELQTIMPEEAVSGGIDSLRARLRNPVLRERYKRWIYEHKEEHLTPVPTLVADGMADNIIIDGVTLGEIARRQKIDPADAAMDILRDSGGRLIVLQHHYEADLRKIAVHPLVMIMSDGFIPQYCVGVPNPRCYGVFPLIFRKYVRGETRPEEPKEVGIRILSLHEAVRKMTSFPAQKLGLTDRGLIREGMRADIVIFDPETISDKTTYANPHQYPEGIPFVIVNGTVVIDNGRHTGARPGMVLKATRSGR